MFTHSLSRVFTSKLFKWGEFKWKISWCNVAEVEDRTFSHLPSSIRASRPTGGKFQKEWRTLAFFFFLAVPNHPENRISSSNRLISSDSKQRHEEKQNVLPVLYRDAWCRRKWNHHCPHRLKIRLVSPLPLWYVEGRKSFETFFPSMKHFRVTSVWLTQLDVGNTGNVTG